MLSAETWMPVPGYEGMYEVSDHGRVRSTRRSVPVILRWRDTRGLGYRIVQLYDREGRHKWSVGIHRLMMMAFVGGGVGLEARHKNGNPADNRLENLEWGSHSDNILDSVRHGTHNQARKTHCPAGHAYTPENTRRRRNERECRICIAAQGRRSAERRRSRQQMALAGPGACGGAI